jgi:hypothetical protein
MLIRFAKHDIEPGVVEVRAQFSKPGTIYVVHCGDRAVWTGEAEGTLDAFAIARTIRPDLADVDLECTANPPPVFDGKWQSGPEGQKAFITWVLATTAAMVAQPNDQVALWLHGCKEALCAAVDEAEVAGPKL